MLAITLTADAKKKKVKEVMSPTELVESIKWSHEPGTSSGVDAVDKILNAGDELYAHIQEIIGGMTFYDVKKIAIAGTNDTIVTVVDDQGNIRDKYGALLQYINAAIGLTVIGSDIVDTSKKAIELKDHFKEVVDIKDPLQSLNTLAQLGTAIKQIKEMGEVVKVGLMDNFSAQKSKIRTFIKESDKATGLNDPILRNLPDVTLSDDVLTKSEEKVMAELKKAQEDGDRTLGGEDGSTILNFLNS